MIVWLAAVPVYWHLHGREGLQLNQESKHVIGLYCPDMAVGQALLSEIPDGQFINTLQRKECKSIDCLVLDIRSDAPAILKSFAKLEITLPVLALVTLDQEFPDSYPFDCHIHDVFTESELGSQLFYHRVNSAVQVYAEPLQFPHTLHPSFSVFQEIVNHSSDWIFIKDLEHRFLLASDNYAKTAGIPISDILGKNDLELGSSEYDVYGDPKDGWAGFWPQDDAVTSTGKIMIEENPNWELYSDTPRYLRTIRVPLKNIKGEVYALLVSSEDITEQKQNEMMLAERTAMLARVTEEKQKAEESRRLSEEAVAAKNKFLAAASHDLRQPLHAMGLFLDILDTRMRGSDERQLVQQIKGSCNALNNLFNSCLDISRLDAGVVDKECEDFYAASLMQEMEEEFNQQAAEKYLNYIQIVDDSVVYSDPMLLGRIIRNLVNNAIQNTDKGQVLVRCIRKKGIVALSVEDTGCGIPKDERLNIFNEFHQINERSARQGKGLGLGLAIVKRLCALLDINLELKANVGTGSIFTLEVPIGNAKNIVAASLPDPSISFEDTCILVIDDDTIIRSGMVALLNSYGCDTVSAHGAKAAARLLNSMDKIPDVIVVDYQLGNGETGSEAIDLIQDLVGFAIPAVLVTGDTSSGSIQDAATRSVPVLHKPVSAHSLLAAVASELQRQSSLTDSVVG